MYFCEIRRIEIVVRPNEAPHFPKFKKAIVTSYFQTPTRKWTCEIAQDLGNCLLPDVKNYCEPNFLPIFKEVSNIFILHLKLKSVPASRFSYVQFGLRWAIEVQRHGRFEGSQCDGSSWKFCRNRIINI